MMLTRDSRNEFTNTTSGKNGWNNPRIGLEKAGNKGRATPKVIKAFASAPPKKPISNMPKDKAVEASTDAAQSISRSGVRKTLVIVRMAATGSDTTQTQFETSLVFKSLHEPKIRNPLQATTDRNSTYVKVAQLRSGDRLFQGWSKG